MIICAEKMNTKTGDYNSIEIEYNAENKAEVEEAGNKLAPFMPKNTIQKSQENAKNEARPCIKQYINPLGYAGSHSGCVFL